MILFPLILLIIQLPFFLQDPSPLGTNISVFNNFFGTWSENYTFLFKLSKVVIVLLSAISLYSLVNKLELQRVKGHHALYWFGFLNSFFLGAEMDLSIPIANLFVILSLSRTLSVYRDSKAYSVAFDAGLYLGCAILFNPFYFLLILFTFIALSTLKTLNYREVILAIAGLLAPVIMVTFVIYFFDLSVPSYFGQLSWTPGEMFDLIKNNVNDASVLSFIGNLLTIVVIVYGVFKIIQIANSENTKRSKVFQLFFILTVFMAIIQLLSKLNGMNVPSIIILSVPLSGLMIHFFTGAKLTWISISLFYIWLIIAIVNGVVAII
ncbi:MAG: hypothetical protein ACI8XB_000265 [Patiriisocius sp.]|jgi:hypothetical protein